MMMTDNNSSQSRYNNLSNSDKYGLLEYNDIVHNYFTEILNEKGLQTSLDHASISVEQHSREVEEIHLEVQQKLQTNPRAIELMKYFGID